MSYTAFPLSHYANGFFYPPHGTGYIEAKQQPEIQSNGFFDKKFP